MKKIITLALFTLSLGSFANHSITDRQANTIMTFSPFITTASPFLSTTDSIKHREEAEVLVEEIAIYELSGEASEKLANTIALVMEQEGINAAEAVDFLYDNAQSILK